MATRRERVILELEDNFTSGMARAAAATAVLNRELNGLSGTSVRTTRDNDRLGTSLRNVGSDADRAGAGLRRSSADLNQFTGRLGLAVRAVAAFGPALVPIGGALLPVLSGLTVGVTAAGGAAGAAVLAFTGLGDAMSALDAHQLEPTADSLAKLRDEMNKIGPSAAEFVRYLDGLEPEILSLREAARQGLFPGVEQSIDTLLTKLPETRELVHDLGAALGQIAADSARGLTGDGFRSFFDYMESDAVPTLHAFAMATGNVATGLANLLVGFAPVSRDFTGGLVAATQAFEDWTAGLENNRAFQDFIEYLRSTGPQVAEFLGQFALSLAAIMEAAAPVGQVLLPMLTALAAVVENLAKSDLGTPLLAGVAAMSALRLATQAWGKVAQTSVAGFVTGQGRAAASIFTVVSAQDRARMSATQLAAAQRAQTTAAIAGAGRLAAVLGGLTIASTAAGDGLGLTNTASLALMGSFAGPVGAGLGAGVGVLLDMRSSAKNAEEALRAFNDALESGDPAQFSAALEQVNVQLERQTQNTILGTSFMGETVGKVANFLSPLSNVDKAMGQLTGSTDELREATDKQGPSADQAAAAMRRLADGDYEVTTKAGATRNEINQLVSAMEDQRSAALGAFDAVTQYAQALINARKQAEKTNLGIEITNDMTRKQRLRVLENRDALSQLAAAWNNQSTAVRNSNEKFREARGQFIETATAMGVPIEQARKLASRLLEIPRQRVIDIQLMNIDKSSADLQRIKREVESIPRRWQTDYYVNQINTISRRFDPAVEGLRRAAGGTIPGPRHPYRDKVLAYLAPGEEVITNRNGEADRFRADRAAGRIPAYANGGTAGQSGFGLGAGNNLRRTLDDQLAIAQVMQQIRDLRRSLNKDGKDKLEGLNRRIAELELRRAQKELKLAETREAREARQEQRERLREQRQGIRSAGQGLSFDSLLPSEPQTVAQGVASEIADFRAQVLAAGGEWTREMRDWARDMRVTAREYDATAAAIATETERREALAETLNEQQSQLDDLNRTMQAFGAAVAANFLNNGFNQSSTRTVEGTPGAASAALAQAQADLAAIQAQGGPQAAAQASRLMQQIALLQPTADAEVAPVEQTVDGLDALRETLRSDATNAEAFTAALQKLVVNGLDPLSGFYQELAQSGDLLTAQQLVAAGPSGVDELADLWQQRDAATAELAAMTTQAVYGEQQAALQSLIDQTKLAIEASDATLTLLNAELVVLGAQVKAGAEDGVEALRPQLRNLRLAIDALPTATARELQAVIRKGGA